MRDTLSSGQLQPGGLGLSRPPGGRCPTARNVRQCLRRYTLVVTLVGQVAPDHWEREDDAWPTARFVAAGSGLSADDNVNRNHDLAPRQSMRCSMPARSRVRGALRERRRGARDLGVPPAPAASPAWSTAPNRSRRRSSRRAPTGTCCWSVAPSRTWRCCWQCAWRCWPIGALRAREPRPGNGSSTRVGRARFSVFRRRAPAVPAARSAAAFDHGKLIHSAVSSPDVVRPHDAYGLLVEDRPADLGDVARAEVDDELEGVARVGDVVGHQHPVS